MKKILISSIILLSIFLIYLGNMDRKVYYLALGDSFTKGLTPYGNVEYSYTDYVKDYLQELGILEEYVNEYVSTNYRVTDLINDINNNKKISNNKNSKRLKNALIKADLVTLSIGSDELLSKITLNSNMTQQDIYNYIDELFFDLDKLFKLMRQYCKEDIILIGYYNPFRTSNYNTDEIFKYLDQKYNVLTRKYNINYIDIYKDLNKDEYFENPKSIYPNSVGYELISKKIIDKLKTTTLK